MVETLFLWTVVTQNVRALSCYIEVLVCSTLFKELVTMLDLSEYLFFEAPRSSKNQSLLKNSVRTINCIS